MSKVNHHQTTAERRAKRVRAKVRGTAERPRVSVHRSNQYMYVQAIDDVKAETVAAATEKEMKEKGTKTERAQAVAKILAEKMKKLNIKAAVFDRGSYRYFGRVKAVADTLREAGIQV